MDIKGEKFWLQVLCFMNMKYVFFLLNFSA
jgi:hypothetical protein